MVELSSGVTAGDRGPVPPTYTHTAYYTGKFRFCGLTAVTGKREARKKEKMEKKGRKIEKGQVDN